MSARTCKHGLAGPCDRCLTDLPAPFGTAVTDTDSVSEAVERPIYEPIAAMVDRAQAARAKGESTYLLPITRADMEALLRSSPPLIVTEADVKLIKDIATGVKGGSYFAYPLGDLASRISDHIAGQKGKP